MTGDQDTPGARLALLMRRRGWSAPRLAELAGGVSASSIRSYAADRSTPRPQQALAVAGALGAADGRALLDAWGYTDLADGFSAQRPEGAPVPHPPVAEAVGGPMSDPGVAVLQALASWIRHVETARPAEQ